MRRIEESFGRSEDKGEMKRRERKRIKGYDKMREEEGQNEKRRGREKRE